MRESKSEFLHEAEGPPGRERVAAAQIRSAQARAWFSAPSDGISTAYGHQSSIAASVGQVVAQGQTIGYVGCTGHCFGPHLHFEVRINGTPVDPLGYL